MGIILEKFHQFLDVWNIIYSILSSTAFIWAPIVLALLLRHFWILYVQADFISKQFQWVMLEVKLPKEIHKTPAAMELVLESFYHVNEGTWLDRIWYGKVKPWFSLEMISIEGDVKFFIRTPSFYKNLIESHIYAEYPGVEIYEVPDYTSIVRYSNDSEWNLWGCEFVLTKPDPFPIKTYVDYGLDKVGIDEEQKNDPIIPTIEFLGSVGQGQQVWIQLLIQGTGRRFSTKGKWFKKHDWRQEGKDIIAGMSNKKSANPEEKVQLTNREKEIIKAIERNISKTGFDCGMRAIYLAKKSHFDPVNIAGLIGTTRQYSSTELNGFRPNNTTSFNYPWQDYNEIRVSKRKRRLFDAYVRRSFFHPPYERRPFVLNSEELATIYHFPGGVAETPTFARIESKKSEPPANLPI